MKVSPRKAPRFRPEVTLVFLLLLFFSGGPDIAFGLTVEDVARELMSPACPGRFLVNCPSAEGEQLRELIRQKIEKGESKQQIIRYFVDAYGPQVLPSPPKEGFFWTLWGFPFLMIVNAGVVILLVALLWVRRRGGIGRGLPSLESGAATGREIPVRPGPGEETEADAAGRRSQEARYLERVERELEEFDR